LIWNKKSLRDFQQRVVALQLREDCEKGGARIPILWSDYWQQRSVSLRAATAAMRAMPPVS
jgi:hypothetical protein